MPNYRMDRTSEDILRELTAILRTVKDPRVNATLLSIVRVEVTRDMSYATVYVSSMDGLEAAKEAVKGLRSAAGYMRHELGAALRLRCTPSCASRRMTPSSTAPILPPPSTGSKKRRTRMTKLITEPQAAAMLRQADHILLLAHQYPDGDTLGSNFALCRALQSLGKTVRVLCGDPIPERYEYMFSDLPQPDFTPQFICALDVADAKLLGPRRAGAIRRPGGSVH